MTNITIKTAEQKVEVFSKEGTSLGTFTGQQANAVMIYLENPTSVPFIKVKTAKNKFTYINRDCTCKSLGEVTLGSKVFDDMSKPMAECHPIAVLKYTVASGTVAVGSNVTPVLEIPPHLTVTYTSSDPTIATVDKNGKITGVKTGVATIKAVTKDPTKHSESEYKVTVTG
ncbi:structural protein [Lactococcus phage P087]|uniref:Structural protein n=1 Tax=Lactococcus phage P087 TaxID=641487 RepID=C3U2P9_9CAUD|nr:tail protein [Lactococcus phage P087]ACP41735.1 structural protein [Lactococcus phage P087]